MGQQQKKPRYNVMSVRVTDLEREEFAEIASRYSLTMSETMRHAVTIYAHSLESSPFGGRG